ncbi:MAG: hypothetical protein V5A59_14305, partial [Bacteroidales bacterium]
YAVNREDILKLVMESDLIGSVTYGYVIGLLWLRVYRKIFPEKGKELNRKNHAKLFVENT